MTNECYQKKAHSFASYGGNRMYPYAGLAEEAGEVLGKLAKYIREHDGICPHGRSRGDVPRKFRTQFRGDIRKELGDVLWMVAEIATVNRLRISDIMDANIAKLADRKRRGVINGSGDDR